MGMAASQARFLNLTARKNNVEFEGQQINQQRTTLSNESANYYSDLLGMTVPTPPSVDDYTKITYSFSDGALTNTLTSLIPTTNAQGQHVYTISYNKSYTDDFAIVSAASSVVTNAGTLNHILKNMGDMVVNTSGSTTTYNMGSLAITETTAATSISQELAQKLGIDLTINPVPAGQLLQYTDGTNTYYTKKPTAGDGTYQNTTFFAEETNIQSYKVGIKQLRKLGEADTCDEYLDNTLTTKDLSDLLEQEQAYLAQLQSAYGASTTWFVRYVQNTSTNTWNPVFYNEQDLTGATYDDTGYSQNTINCYTIGSKTRTDEIKNVKNCVLEKDSTGRFISISIPIDPSDPSKTETYELSTHTITDQDKYDDAMNDYEFKKAQYDKSIQNINAKIEIIQQQDKNLELRLKQLDTEEQALNNELEAVKKVIQTNVQTSFKTFQG